MQLAHILIAAFAILANAQRYHPHGFHIQQKRAAQVAGSNPDSDTGPNSGSDSGSSSGTGTGSGTAGNDTSNAAASSAPQSSVSSTSSTTSGSSSSSSSNYAVGSTASFTQYGPCNDPSKTSCAWYSSTGFNAAISQAVYGGYPGSGPSAACGICWKLTPDYAGANEIFVKVNNLCPDDQNPLCAQPADVDINFDLCEDSGAAAALFGSSNVQQVNGTAAIVDCSNWSGGANVCLPGVESC
ncbi:MAG: hypothetical protein ALECFALPRED_000836 [Alectoria fallacina]|uniref:Expansin-like EG45 domain-containing protein n=1 Tax=Alectoria fallacina TaxID=1903189 RepID=A0A8H3F6V9_9LECA|nr:MAG: hypothetical protein ALECFALPRED_000836 [Alectoria fallacina]